ncbi:hypothetical protein JTE90_011622 [Oedothorax gibbosus]|uniref:Uncharacterized protein n=1 Tax=Oedothorax gibbosus TaxID=931172 RepID=A0AAV6U4Q3_9ARAC|nr:hypothetical protein JTE90_011622 [Oedothorax gibbosus]
MASSETIAGPVRLGSIEGDAGKKNEILYHEPQSEDPSGCVVFFGGDMQDYKENMLAHRDNKHYAHWDLESTATLLHCHFPEQVIVIIKPSKMTLKTFSCYKNFVPVNDFGAPTYENNTDSLKHLKLILQSISRTLHKEPYSKNPDKYLLSELPTTLIGFSKGCTVLNQFMYSFHKLLEEPTEDMRLLVAKITSMYWLEGGHSGSSSTWVTDKKVLQSFSNYSIETFIHVTPYQVHCDTRPRIGKEEKIFRETLSRLKVNVTRKLHFENEPRSVEMHFQVLKVFR